MQCNMKDSNTKEMERCRHPGIAFSENSLITDMPEETELKQSWIGKAWEGRDGT